MLRVTLKCSNLRLSMRKLSQLAKTVQNSKENRKLSCYKTNKRRCSKTQIAVYGLTKKLVRQPWNRHSSIWARGRPNLLKISSNCFSSLRATVVVQIWARPVALLRKHLSNAISSNNIWLLCHPPKRPQETRRIISTTERANRWTTSASTEATKPCRNPRPPRASPAWASQSPRRNSTSKTFQCSKRCKCTYLITNSAAVAMDSRQATRWKNRHRRAKLSTCLTFKAMARQATTVPHTIIKCSNNNLPNNLSQNSNWPVIFLRSMLETANIIK